MDSFFRRDVLEQESILFFQQCFSVPKFLQIKYNLPNEDQEVFNRELLFKNNLKVTLPIIDSKKFLLETFMRGCFKKCKQFVLEDYVDFDEIDCTMKCANKSKESYQILESLIVPGSNNNQQ